MFAPAHHAATRYVVPVRKELAVRTIFNFLGPLTNPAGARRQLIGVADAGYLERIAGALARLGVDRALVVSSEDGLDEMSTSGPTHVVEVDGEQRRRATTSTPEDVGLDRGAPDGGRRRDAARRTPRPRARSSPASPARARDLAVLNAGAAIYAGGARRPTRATGVDAARARRSTSGAAAQALERLRRALSRGARRRAS